MLLPFPYSPTGLPPIKKNGYLPPFCLVNFKGLQFSSFLSSYIFLNSPVITTSPTKKKKKIKEEEKRERKRK
jgi:hypothetical protein